MGMKSRKASLQGDFRDETRKAEKPNNQGGKRETI
jgi:hypothetical protein